MIEIRNNKFEFNNKLFTNKMYKIYNKEPTELKCAHYLP